MNVHNTKRLNVSKSSTSKNGIETNLKEIESVISALESGEYSLEESLELFEKGTALINQSRKILEVTEQKIKILSEPKTDET